MIERSALGKNDDAVEYAWKPLWQMDEKTKADIAQVKAATIKTEVETGLINEDVLRDSYVNVLINDETYPGLEDAIDKYGAEPEEPDIEVPWSRLAGAMAAMSQQGAPGAQGGPPQLQKPPGLAGLLGPPKPPQQPPQQQKPDDLPGLMSRLGVREKAYPSVRVSTQSKDRKPSWYYGTDAEPGANVRTIILIRHGTGENANENIAGSILGRQILDCTYNERSGGRLRRRA